MQEQPLTDVVETAVSLRIMRMPPIARPPQFVLPTAYPPEASVIAQTRPMVLPWTLRRVVDAVPSPQPAATHPIQPISLGLGRCREKLYGGLGK